MSIKSDKWIRRMSEEFGMIDPSSRTKSKKPTDSASSPTVRPATATISAAPMNLKFYQHQQHHRRSQNFDPKISLPSKTTAASSAQFLRTGAHGRIFPHSAQRPDRLFGQIHLRPLRHHRQRYPVRAGMGRLRYPRVFNTTPARQNLRRRRRGASPLLRERRSV